LLLLQWLVPLIIFLAKYERNRPSERNEMTLGENIGRIAAAAQEDWLATAERRW